MNRGVNGRTRVVGRKLLPWALLIAVAAGAHPCAAAAGGDGPPEGDADWWSDVGRHIADSEYAVTWQDRTYLNDLEAAWQAPNRANGFRTYFAPDGIRVIPRTDEVAWEWGLTLAGYGRGPDVRSVPVAVLAAEGNRMRYARHEVTEWYVNDRRGLEQGFTLEVPPERCAAASSAISPDGTAPGARPLREGEGMENAPAFLALELTGDLSPRVSPDGQSIDFRSAGRIALLRYAKLRITDASGRELPSWMETFSDRGVAGIRLVFDDREASYPLTVDPLASAPSWAADGEVAGDRFGRSVATAGDVNGDGYGDVVVGAYLFDTGLVDAGKVYVFHGSATGLSAVPDWTATGIQTGDGFGYAVATAGDVNGDGIGDLIVGAPGRDGVLLDEGRALVYHGSTGGLDLADWQKAGFAQAGALFGSCVGTAGDVNGDGYSDVIVGAVQYDDGAETDAGAVQIYHGSGTGLAAVADWTTTGGLAGVEYGQGCGTAGDVNGDGYADVIVGADKYPAGGLTESGRAFAFYGSASGLPLLPDWTRDGAAAGDLFGRRAASVGDVNGDGYADVGVAAPYRDHLGTDRGCVYVIRGGASGLGASGTVGLCGTEDDSHFGEAVGPAGDVNGDGYADILVGAPDLDDTGSGLVDTGRAYLFLGRLNGPGTSVEWSVTGEEAGALLGSSIATAGDVNGDGYSDIVVGAPGAAAATGRAYVYRGSALEPGSVSTEARGSEDGEALGYSVAAAGDVNGDGYGDLIVGGPGYDGGVANRGTAIVLHGTDAGFGYGWSVQGAEAEALLGAAVGGAGDVDGDGYDDVIVSAPLLDAGGVEDAGRVYVYGGSPGGVSNTPSWTADGTEVGEQFGYSVAGAGDVNGDGYADVIVGAVGYGSGESGEGGAFVYQGSEAGLAASPDWIAQSNQAGALLGGSVAGAGDVNGDGYSDVIVGADYFDGAAVDGGAAWVYLGASTGLRSIPFWFGSGSQAGGEYGHRVASAGDVDGDGFSDVIVGATRQGFDQFEEGRAYVYHGGPSSIGGPFWTFEADQEQAYLGAAVACAGDVNGDGYADVIVGADRFDNAYSDEGRAWVFFGSPSGLSPLAAWTADGYQSGAQFGYAVAGGADLNGDGYADPVVGAPWKDEIPFPGAPDVGYVAVHFGNSLGRDTRPRQRLTLAGGPVAHLGASDETDRLGLGLVGRTPFGRGRVRYEWEVEPLGVPLDGTGTETSLIWSDTGTDGDDVEVASGGLEEGAPYHWRIRVLYDPVTYPFQQHGPWLTVPRNAATEADVRTRCDSPAPSGTTTLMLDRSGPDAVLAWDPVAGGAGYDVVGGPLAFLVATAGNFRLATSRCLGNDIGALTTSDAAIPAPGDCLWYLVRGVTCGGVATYDSGGPSQQGSRDAEVADANPSCP